MSSDKVKFSKEVKEKWELVLKDDDPLNWIVMEFGTDRKHKNRVRSFFFCVRIEIFTLFLSHSCIEEHFTSSYTLVQKSHF